MNWKVNGAFNPKGEGEQAVLPSGHAFKCRNWKKKNQIHSGGQALEGGQHMSEQHFAVMKT